VTSPTAESLHAQMDDIGAGIARLQESNAKLTRALAMIELFARAALDGKGLGDRPCIEAIHVIAEEMVPNPIGYDQISLL
jgi:hypothetical protein